MPWLETDPVTERKRFIMGWLSGEFAVAEFCRRHEISRKTGYKWIARYEREGPEGLEDRSKRPGNCPGAVEPDLIEEAIRIRYSRHQILGARKVRPWLVGLYSDQDIPCERTLHRHFVRRGLVKKRRRSRISQVRYVTHRYSLDRPSVPPRALGREPTLVARQLVLQRPAAGSFHVERASQ